MAQGLRHYDEHVLKLSPVVYALLGCTGAPAVMCDVFFPDDREGSKTPPTFVSFAANRMWPGDPPHISLSCVSAFVEALLLLLLLQYISYEGVPPTATTDEGPETILSQRIFVDSSVVWHIAEDAGVGWFPPAVVSRRLSLSLRLEQHMKRAEAIVVPL